MDIHQPQTKLEIIPAEILLDELRNMPVQLVEIPLDVTYKEFHITRDAYTRFLDEWAFEDIDELPYDLMKSNFSVEIIGLSDTCEPYNDLPFYDVRVTTPNGKTFVWHDMHHSYLH